jgi:hypothetical protein
MYSKIEIEIADYIFANPDKKRGQILSHFVAICRKSRRTIERYYKKADEYNLSRIRKQENVREKELVSSATESVKKAIISRSEAEEILSSIAKGDTKQIGEELIVPSAGEQINAIKKLSEMNGWDKYKWKEVISQVTIFELPDNGRSEDK